MPEQKKLIAFVAPMAVFLALLASVSLFKSIGGAFWLSAPEYWIYPAQTIICAAQLFYFRRRYLLGRPARVGFTVAIAVFVFLLWVAPQTFFGAAPRLTGFNPDTFADRPSLYWSTVVFRFARLVVVVPLVEEIFWRGFLLRYFIRERFTEVPFGQFSPLSFAVVTLSFTFTHSGPDWPAAFITGMLYNSVAYRSKSLASCVLAHAITNLCLGLWIMATRQWGFW